MYAYRQTRTIELKNSSMKAVNCKHWRAHVGPRAAYNSIIKEVIVPFDIDLQRIVH